MSKGKISIKSLVKLFLARLSSVIFFALSILIFFSTSFLPGRLTEISSLLLSILLCTSFVVLLISVCRRSNSQFDLYLKRAFDILFSLSFILFSFPIFAIVALIIFFEAGWPIFSIQKRIGFNQKYFNCLRFRTTIQESKQERAGNEFDHELDTKIDISGSISMTRIGTFLRKTSLDEIPLFFNVLIGDMSIVGPRPLTVRDFDHIRNDQSLLRRFSVKPGVTGLWQVSGRNDISFEEWMNLDLYYVDKWNIMLDFKILLKTIPAVLLHTEIKKEQ